MQSDVYKRWEALGFLTGLDENQAVGLAEEFQKLAEYMQLNLAGGTVNSVFGKMNENVQVLAFPALRRAFVRGLNEKYSPRALCEKIKNEYDQEVRKIKEKSMTNIDAEAEYCAIVADYFSRDNKRK